MLADPATLECTYANAAAPERLRMIESLQSGKTRQAELEVTRPGSAADDNGESTIGLRLQRLAAGNVSKVAAIGHDITERKKLDKMQAELHARMEQHHRELSRNQPADYPQ